MVRAWVVVALALALSAQERVRPNVLLVTVDALRADRVTDRLTPGLVALARRGAAFARTYAHAPLTLPSHASILTGLLPPAHGVRNNGFRLDEGVVTLAEAFADAGYRTGAFVGGSALDARFGLAQGFHEYDDRYDVLQGPSVSSAFRQGARPSPAVLAAAAAWIATQPAPWFAWAHLRDPHAPYVSYDSAVRSADTSLGAFLASLGQDTVDRTLVIVTADHGESLGEHGERTHGLFAYEGVMRVPLVVAGPGVPLRVVRTPVTSHADVMPTILDLAGVIGPRSDGRSRVPALRGEEMPEHPVYVEALDAALMRGGAPLTGVVSGQWKFIDLPVPELYDVVSDPGEQTNRVAAEPGLATRLRDLTVSSRTASFRADGAGSLAEPEARARLRSLGYVGSASWRLGASRVEDDPKRLLPLHLAYEGALETAGGDPEAAIRQLQLIVQQRPDFTAAIDATGALLIARGRPKEAVALLGDARAGGLRHRVIAERLAAALLAAKDPRGAVAVLQPVVKADEWAADARFILARAHSAIGQPIEAAEQLRAALRIDPTFAAASDLLARLTRR
ncbi:MAG: sulfatase-like hydrolase/transferase [Vicinamibacterales bacterium]